MKRLTNIATIFTLLLIASCGHNSEPVITGEETSQPSTTQENVKFTFRKTYWGMTPEQVMLAEDSNSLTQKSESRLYFKSTISNLDCILLYNFNSNKLTDAAYIITNENILASNKYLEEYKNLFNLLTEKYGEPITNDTIWHDKTFFDNPDKWGDAMLIGQLQFMSTWKTEETMISLNLAAEQSMKVSFAIYYADTNYVREKSSQNKKENNNNL